MSAASGELREVALEDLVKDASFQVRGAINRGTVAAYANALRAGVEMPPVKVARIGGALVLVDGWHRAEAHRLIGWASITAEVVQCTPTEAAWLAAQANLAHGLPLGRKGLRNAFRAFMRAGKHRIGKSGLVSLRDITRELGGSMHHETIRRWMKRDFPNIASRYAGEERGKRLELAGPDPDTVLAGHAEEALRKAIAAARGIACEGQREALAALAEEAARTIREGSPAETQAVQEVLPTVADVAF